MKTAPSLDAVKKCFPSAVSASEVIGRLCRQTCRREVLFSEQKEKKRCFACCDGVEDLAKRRSQVRTYIVAETLRALDRKVGRNPRRYIRSIKKTEAVTLVAVKMKRSRR